MNQNICNSCGGEYDYHHGRWVCRSCGSYKPETITNEEVTLLYTAFQKLRLSEFYEAELDFDDIIHRYPENPNAYWGRLMARYGIKYEQDFDGRMIPTCYAASIESVMNDGDYQKALQYADAESKAYYTCQAEYMERVRCEWVEKAQKEKPYDIFICYKDSDLANGIVRTEDSIAAQDLYIHLTNQGYRVFYSHESLRDKVGEKYEPYIFNALSTAKVMLVYGSKPEYITSTWLKNEWTRYEKRIQAGVKDPNSLLVACEGFSPSELPTALASRQCFNASEKSFYGDLDEKIASIIHPEKREEALAYAEGKKKSKAPRVISLLLLLAAIGGFLAWGFIGGDLIRLPSIYDQTHGVTVEAQTGGFKGKTELVVSDLTNSGEWSSVVQNLHVETNGLVLYGLDLRRNNKTEAWSGGDMTVRIPLPNGISEARVAVYDIGAAMPKKLSIEIIDGNIVFTTNQLSEYLIARREHTIVTDKAVYATCTETGLKQGSHCADCGEVIVAQEVIPATGHSSSGAATCTKASTCTRCQAVLQPAKGHTPGAAATCTAPQKCTVCNVTLVTTLPHTPGAAATCTTSQKCTVCNKELAAPLGHTPGVGGSCVTPSACVTCGVLVETPDAHAPGAAATCTTAQICTLCKKELKAAKGHNAGAWETVKQATKTENGLRVKKCKTCGEIAEQEVIPATGSEGLSYYIDNGSYIINGIGTCTDTDIVIPAKINGYKVTAINSWAFNGCTNLTSVVIPDSVTSIGNNAFSNCSSLVSVSLPAGLTSISSETFVGCSSLTSIALPSGVTSIGGNAFYGCTDLTSVTLSSGVTSIGYWAFGDCTNLTSVVIPDSVTSIGYCAFNGCTGLTSVTLPSGLTSIEESTFGGCTGLTSITLPSGLKTIGNSAFNECRSLTSITIPASVTSIGNDAFLNCRRLESVVISHGVTSIGEGAFSQCDSLTSVIIPGSVTSIGNRAFQSCSALTSIAIPDGVKTIGESAFASCNNLTSITIPTSVTKIGYRAFAWINSSSVSYGGTTAQWNSMDKDSFWSDGSYIQKIVCTDGSLAQDGSALLPGGSDNNNSNNNEITDNNGLSYYIENGSCIINGIGTCTDTDLVIPSTIGGYSVTAIENWAFGNCTNLTSVVIPDSVTSIRYSAFNGCTGLTSITLPSGLTSIEESTFCGCSSLTSIALPSGLTTIGNNAFNLCSSLANITFPDGLTSIGQAAFYQCRSLTSITIPSSVTSIGGDAFYVCRRLESVVISHGVTSIGESAFSGCDSLTSVVIPGSVTSIGNWAFNSCTALTSVTIPSSVTSIGKGAFQCCYALTSLVIQGGVKTIGESAFASCNALTSITIPTSVTKIGYQAFSWINSASVSYGGTIAQWNAMDRDSYWCEGSYIEKYVCTDGTLSQDGILLPSQTDNLLAFTTNSDGTCIITGIGTCTDTDLVIPSMMGGYRVTGIRYDAFQDCKNLTSVIIPDTVKSIGYDAFWGCNNLKTVNIPSGVTSIESWTFGYCSSLESMVIPVSVTSIGHAAFYDCVSLTSISYNGTTSQWNAINKDSLWNTNIEKIVCTDAEIILN